MQSASSPPFVGFVSTEEIARRFQTPEIWYSKAPPTPFGLVQEAQTSAVTTDTSKTLVLTGVAAGDLIVVGIVWGISASVALGTTVSVTDDKGNVYRSAVGLNVGDLGLIQGQIFFAKNTAAGTTTITVTFAHVCGGAHIYAAEYTGLDKNDPVDTASAAQGTGTSFNSGNLVTDFTDDLLVGLGYSANSISPGSGFTQRGTISSDPLFGGRLASLFEDKTTGSPGTYSASFSQGISGYYLALAVAFNSPVQPRDTEAFYSADAYVLVPPTVPVGFVNLAGNIIPKITDPNAFVKLNSTLLQQNLAFVQLSGTIKGTALKFINLAGTIVVNTRSYVKLQGTLSLGGSPTHGADVVVSLPTRSYVQLAGTVLAKLSPGACGSMPDASYVKLAGWLVVPGQSAQSPGSYLRAEDDFNASAVAGAIYTPTSLVVLNGINLIVTAFTTGVISFQTRTRQWLRRVDAAASGTLLTTEVNTRTLPTGQIITTTTQRKQIQDTLVTIVTVQDSGTPGITTSTISEKTKTGREVKREIKTQKTAGIIHTVEKKTLLTSPPLVDNIQPVTVRTLDGVSHFQFFDSVNPEFAGGEEEGLTETDKAVQIVPSSLAGSTVDALGNPILARITDETIKKPTGEVRQVHTEEIGVQREFGTTISDTNQEFDGIQTTTHQITTYPDGSQQIVDTIVNNLTGDSVETTTETSTSATGQVTTVVTTIERKTFPDPVTGKVRTTENRTVKTTVGEVTTVDSTVVTNDDFEDSIINKKVKVYLVQEFTITCMIDWQNMGALLEQHINHQKNFALLELFGQQLGNANLSFALRQSLIQQYDQAIACITPMTLQALGKTHQVVFAASASAFRAKYIPGPEPAVYELQLILQSRSDLLTGARGF